MPNAMFAKVAGVWTQVYPTPGIPSAVTLRAASGDAQVVLTWPAATGATTSYEVSQDGAITDVGLVLTKTVTGLTNGTPYVFKVRALSGLTRGAWSNEVTIAPFSPSLLANRRLHIDAKDPLSYPGSGGTWTDLSGAGNHMTINGLVYNGGGWFTGNGSSTSASRGTMASPPSPGTLTLFACVRPTGAAFSGIRQILSLSRNDSDTEFVFYLTAAGKIVFMDYAGSAGFGWPESTTGDVTVSAWRTVAFVMNGTAGKFYLNGVADGTAVSAGARAWNADNLILGHDPVVNGRQWLGDIASAFVFASALSDADILSLHNYYKGWLGF